MMMKVMSNETAIFTRYDKNYYTYQTTLDDPRLKPFIDAMLQSKPVLFQEKAFYIKRILLSNETAIIVFRLVRNEN